MSRKMFQIGDVVRVKTAEELKATEGARIRSEVSLILDGVNFVDLMFPLCGEEATISKFSLSGGWSGYHLKFHNEVPSGSYGWVFNDEMLMPVCVNTFNAEDFKKLLEGD